VSRKAIVPIHYKNIGLTILNQDELFKLYKEKPSIYNVLYASGDAQRMSFSFSKQLPCVNNKSRDYTFENFIGIDEDPLAVNSASNLYSGCYTTKTRHIDKKIKIFGPHRHKTLIRSEMSEKNEIVVAGTLHIKEVSVEDMNFKVIDGGYLRLESAMLDSVSIAVEEGGSVGVQDVEFSGNNRECIRLYNGAIVRLYDNVRFFDVYKRFYIETLEQEKTGKVVDLLDPIAILDFLESSYVDNIETFCGLDFGEREVELKQDINFLNLSNEEQTIRIKKLIIASNVRFVGNYTTEVNAVVRGTIGLNVRLEKMTGVLHIEDSERLTVESTHIQNRNVLLDSPIVISSSSVVFDGCNINNARQTIKISSSHIIYRNAQVHGVAELFSPFEKKKDEDSLLLEYKERKNALLMEGCLVTQSFIVGANNFESIGVKRCEIVNSRQVFDIYNTPNVLFERCDAKNNDIFVLLKNSIAEMKHSDFSGGEKALVVDGGKLTVEDVKVTEYDRGVDIISGLLVARESTITKNNFGVELHGDGAILEHYASNISGNNMRDIFMKPGSKIIDLKEIEEYNLCHQE